MSQTQALKIAIIGAGPAGLILARLLSLSPASPSFIITIFESDLTSMSRTSNGGTLDLHPSTGLLAIKKAGLYDKFLEKARYDGTSLVLCDKAGKSWFKIPPSKEGEKGNPEIDRVELRSLLLGSLEGEDGGEVDILWGMKVKGVVKSEEERGGFELNFANGESKSGFDLVVGADGAWSKTRSTYLDTTTKPEYAKITGFEFSIPSAEEKAKEVWEFVNRGSVLAFGDGKGIIGQQLGDGNVHVNAWISTEEGRVDEGVARKTKEEVLEENFEDWSGELKDFVGKAGNESAESRFLYSLPEGYKWVHQPCVTLLGDAAHLMLPFAGEGVNLAFEDAMKLSDAIINGVSGGDLDKNIKEYEEEMFARAKRAQKMTRGMTKAMVFTDGAPRSSVESWILSKIEYEAPFVAEWGWPLIVGLVYGWYFVVKLVS